MCHHAQLALLASEISPPVSHQALCVFMELWIFPFHKTLWMLIKGRIKPKHLRPDTQRKWMTLQAVTHGQMLVVSTSWKWIFILYSQALKDYVQSIEFAYSLDWISKYYKTKNLEPRKWSLAKKRETWKVARVSNLIPLDLGGALLSSGLPTSTYL